MTVTCGPVARAGLPFVIDCSVRASQASRRMGDSVLPGRSVIRSTLANSFSTTSRRLSATPASVVTTAFSLALYSPTWSRTAQIRPSPLDRPEARFSAAHAGATLDISSRTRDHEVPIRALAVSPTITGQTRARWRSSSTRTCGPGPTQFPRAARSCSRMAALSASVSGSIKRTARPIGPW